MAKLPVISGKNLVKMLSKAGFSVLDQHGSHIILAKQAEGKKLKTVIPMHPAIKTGTLLGILRQAQITRKEFEELLEK